MLTLSKIYRNQDWQHVADIAFRTLRLDSRQVQAADALVLLKSAVNHSNEKSFAYARSVADSAAFILSEIDLTAANINTPWLYVPNIRAFLGSLKQAELQAVQPAALPHVIAVTGTNGKTTVTTLIAQLLTFCGKQAALLGTAGNGIYPNLTQATHTTTDSFALQQSLHGFAQQRVDVLCLEASSHGLEQGRLQGVPIGVAIYTNLSRDHLDYHGNMADYAAAKTKLFAFDTLTHSIINTDDAYAGMMQAATQKNALNWCYSLQEPGEFCIRNYELHAKGIKAILSTPFGILELDSPLLGAFNLANLVAAIAAGFALGLAAEQITQAIPHMTGAAGRMQRIEHGERTFLVDYAHTSDALAKALASLKQHVDQGKLWAVFGCGGDRDKGKRPQMMAAALEFADHVVVTADNPRSEAVDDIIADMLADTPQAMRQSVIIEPDRKAAITLVASKAVEGDIVLIAGKGHETYQEIQGTRYDFSDAKVLSSVLGIEQ